MRFPEHFTGYRLTDVTDQLIEFIGGNDKAFLSFTISDRRDCCVAVVTVALRCGAIGFASECG